jgi:type II secretory pathway component PulJ
MGFSTLIDILGSTIIGGMLIMILFRLNDAAVQNTYNYGADLIVQQSLVEVVQLLEYDFKKIGYCRNWTKIANPTNAIIVADSNRIKFITDLNNESNVDTLYYYVGPTDSLTSTPNPSDRMLFRVENHRTPKSANLGITNFKLVYYDALNNKLTTPVADPSRIQTIQLDLTIESSYSYANDYSKVFWRQIRLAARNLRNR